ncbi:RAVE subunit 2/Rogdi [Podospora australis]|uniref:RAVE subunit 2/Rogdi n=1 Tax=Podospora australis TaxID=1536484 RepID=A0AAN6WQK9_9PEZI|nr:RAVE subunit 2/Rogdi [Podospora australis]
MSVEIWPRIAPEQLKVEVESSEVSLYQTSKLNPRAAMDGETLFESWVVVGPLLTPHVYQKRELDWLVQELHEVLTNLKHGLEDCYALLAPIDPGCTLVLSTPRNEIVKGTITRVGTRIVKGTIHLRLRTLPQQTITINPDHPIHLTPLTTLHTLLTHSIDLLNLTLTYSYSPDSPSPNQSSSPQFLSAQLRLLSQSLNESISTLKGLPLSSSDPSWTSRSAAPSHFLPPLTIPSTSAHGPSLSFHITIQDSSLVLWLRTLEPANAPVHFSTKLALAIGTARRLEHDEAEKVFGYCCTGGDDTGEPHVHNDSSGSGAPLAPVLSGTRKRKEVDVFVREKVRVESADPSLLSLTAKLTALTHTLALARQNLAAVMGEELED